MERLKNYNDRAGESYYKILVTYKLEWNDHISNDDPCNYCSDGEGTPMQSYNLNQEHVCRIYNNIIDPNIFFK